MSEDAGDPGEDHPLLMRVLAGIVVLILLSAVVISLSLERDWNSIWNAAIGILFAYIFAAYALGYSKGLRWFRDK